MNHEAQLSGFNLVLDIVDIISLIIKFIENENLGSICPLEFWIDELRQAFRVSLLAQPVSKDVKFQFSSILIDSRKVN